MTLAPARAGRLLAYYGDDLTGSTDAMEALTLAGVRTVLFLDPASPAQLAAFADCQAIGLAGTSRSESPAWMDEHLPPAFEWLRSLDAGVCHYKVCSTFDSHPEVGSIGRALEIGQRVFGQAAVPLVVGVPQLRRHTVFGQLFAAFRGELFRIDRHPVMARHPVTPMDEADLRLHLARQTALPVALVDLLAMRSDDQGHAADAALAATTPQGVLIDVLDLPSQASAGRALWRHRRPRGGLFVIGSSGVEYGLVSAWREAGLIAPAQPLRPQAAVERIAVVSGSCSATTARQIHWAAGQGYALVPLDAPRLASRDEGQAEEDRAFVQALEALRAGRSVIAYTALGPDAMARPLPEDREPHALGRRTGRLLRRLVDAAALERVVIAGGDTSSHGLRELEVHALTVAMPLPQSPGSPLCQVHRTGASGRPLQVALKGGQVGGDDYFEVIRRGADAAPGRG